MGRGDGELERQITFEDLTRIQTATTLTAKQKRIVALLGEGCTQGIIAKRMHVSRSFVSQTVKLLETNNLIKKQSPGNYNSFYILSKELKSKVKTDEMPRVTNGEAHHIRRKYRILHQSNPISMDKRTGFTKSWEMRGWVGKKFWYPGKAGEPNVTVDVTGKSIIVYPDARQKVPAASLEEAEDIMNIACHNVAQKFVREQAKFGVHIEYDEIGTQITPTHYAFPLSRDSPIAQTGTVQANSWTDGSPEDCGDSEHIHYEMTDKPRATALDVAIDRVMEVDQLVKDGIREAMPEAMREFEQSFGPLTAEIKTVMAHIQSGVTIQNQVNQLVYLVGKLMEKQNILEQELEKKPRPEPRREIPISYTPSYED